MRWQYPSQVDVSSEILEAAQGDPLLARLLVQRGFTAPAEAQAFLNPDDYQPASPDVLPDIEAAVERLNRAIERQEPICVWGDFDVDGQTSTALLVSTLQDLAAEVSYYIPNRLTESHGIKLPALQRVLSSGSKLILTCDTGIAEHEAVAAAQAAGVDVIVTDHHDLADHLPPAQAVINPKRLPGDHPLRELPGVGVAYKVAQALYQSYGQPQAGDLLLDLVALGIVADVAQQTGDTRYLLQKGLDRLQSSSRIGLKALLEVANLKTNRLTEDHIAFWLAPRLNALGRLGDANQAVELLTTADLSRARITALQLEGLNDRRKLLVDRVVGQALSQLEDNPALAEYNAIVLAAADWHAGVIGIAASRLAEQYNKPAILISLRPDGTGRGSARSVLGCDIHQAIKMQADLLISFGGHPFAAGLAISPENLTAFRQGLSAALAGCRVSAEKTVNVDLVVELPQVTGSLLSTIQRMAPFGAGNPPVLLGCTGLHVVEERIFGKDRGHKRLTVEDERGCRQEVIWWRGAAERPPESTFDLAFTLSPDDFKGGGAVQLEWIAAREWHPVSVVQAPTFVDCRTSAVNLQSLLKKLPSPLIWAEGGSVPDFPTLPRHKLEPAHALVIWTAPPGQDILERAVAAVKPQQIVLVGHLSRFDTFAGFIKQLMGLIKYAMVEREGEVILEELASALGHRMTTARLGIDWLAAHGKLKIYVEEDELVVVRSDSRPPDAETAAMLAAILKSTLAETEAYRKFFRQARLESVKKILS